MLRDLPRFFRDDADMPTFMTGAPGTENETETENGTPNPPVDLFDDVFGSAPSSPTLQASDGEVSRAPAGDVSDVPRLRSLHVTNGYREGIAVSKELYMQEGFDEGFSLGAELGLGAGWCLGVLTGIVHALPTTSGTSVAEQAGGGRVKQKLTRLSREAESELGMEKLFGREWFGEDGVWTYDVPGQGGDEGEEVTFERIAAAHPVVVKWRQTVLELAAELGMKVD